MPRFERGESVKLINRETAAIRIQQLRMDVHGGTAHFLLNYSDMNTTDPVFGNLQTGKLRLEPKLEGEGIAVSAHMVVLLDPEPTTGTYLVALEDVLGVGRTKLSPFLTSEFRAVSDFPFRDIDDQIKRSRPVVEILGRPSQQLRDDLNAGRLSEIELLTRAANR